MSEILVSWEVAQNRLLSGVSKTAMYSDGISNIWINRNGRIALYLFGEFDSYSQPWSTKDLFLVDNISNADFRRIKNGSAEVFLGRI